MEAKQVIVMRKFQSMRHGKYCAQAAHASMGALLSIAKIDGYGDKLTINLFNPHIKSWLTGQFKKITVYVETEQELIDLYNAAQSAAIPSAIIKDSGLTEFNGIPTITAVGIGPGSSEEIDKITGHLKLF